MRANFANWVLASLIAMPLSVRAATPISACGTTIKTPGAYVVTKNLTIKSSGAASVACITVETSYVAIDLGGFTISCGGDTNAFGILILTGSGAGPAGTIVRNGAITDSCSLALQGLAGGSGMLVERVQTNSNSIGLAIGSGSLVLDSLSNGNAEGIGLACPSNAINDTALGNRSDISLPGGSAGCNVFNTLHQ